MSKGPRSKHGPIPPEHFDGDMRDMTEDEMARRAGGKDKLEEMMARVTGNKPAKPEKN